MAPLLQPHRRSVDDAVCEMPGLWVSLGIITTICVVSVILFVLNTWNKYPLRRLKTMNSEMDKAQAKELDFQRQVNSLGLTQARLRDENGSLRRKVTESDATISTLQVAIRALETEVGRLRPMEEELPTLRRRVGEQMDSVRSLQRDLDTAQRERDSEKDRKQETARRLVYATNRLAELERGNASSNSAARPNPATTVPDENFGMTLLQNEIPTSSTAAQELDDDQTMLEGRSTPVIIQDDVLRRYL